jgi:hypothetical protein
LIRAGRIVPIFVMLERGIDPYSITKQVGEHPILAGGKTVEKDG